MVSKIARTSKENVTDIWNKQDSIKHRGGFPLRPPSEVPEIVRLAFEKNANKAPLINEVILLGVTPEYAQISWPANVNFQAFDQSQEMISSVWQPNKYISSSVTQAFWQDLPLLGNSVDFILGDGCTTQLANQEAYQELFEELSRVIKPKGHIIFRCFIRTSTQDSLDMILKDVFARKIEFFGTLKWRLAMALVNKQDDSYGIQVNKILEAFNLLFDDRNELANTSGWPRGLIDTIDIYKNLDAKYTFPTLAELEQLIGPNFSVRQINYGDYELSDNCPIITLQSTK